MALENIARRFKKELADFLEIPGDIVLDLPKVTLMGNLKLVVENHRGILKFSSEQIQVNVAEGELYICGKDLELQSVMPEEICVTGQIVSVSFQGGI